MTIKVDPPAGTPNLKPQFDKVAALMIAVCVSMAIGALGIFIGIAAHGQASKAISSNETQIASLARTQRQVAALTKQKRAANVAHLAAITATIQAAMLNSCTEGNLHRAVTDGDAKGIVDVLSLLVTAIAHPSAPQTKQQAALSQKYLKRLTADLSSQQIVPQLNCPELANNPTTYVQPPPTYLKPTPAPK